MDINPIRQYLRGSLEQVESLMDSALRSDITLLDATNTRFREHPGKMVRAMLALLVAGACGTPGPDSIRCAAAVELLHNASLLHDDVVDGATERRGMPTVASLLGGGPAVLMGDYWLVCCVRTILGLSRNSDKVIRLFADTLGHLSEGELLQMEKAGKGDTTQVDYERIIFSKTASLFCTAALSAAVSVQAPASLTEAVGSYATNLGMAFQIKDDIFDYRSEADALGKPVGTDLREQKITQPLLSALQKASSEEATRIRGMVTRLGEEPELQEEIRAFVLEHGGVKKAELVMDGFIGKSLQSLSILPETPEKQYLKQLAYYIGQRNN